MCIDCPDQLVLFSTDAILPRVTPNIGMRWFYWVDPLGDHRETLSVLEGLEVDTLGPLHGKPLRPSRVGRQHTSS
ncbi:MAG: hypothetical protein OXH99_10495 [Bryobacterales bacterium]|nr:hypothetical protein [Bryobacterales bacterium]